MVLIDTSIWIRHLRSTYEPLLMLEANDVLRHDLVEGELLIGDTGRRREFLANYRLYAAAPAVPHADVMAFVRAQRLSGRGLSWVDVHLLASARLARATLMTVDRNLAAVARHLGLDA